MNELPEIKNLERQIIDSLVGKKISNVYNSNSPHKFAFFGGDQSSYGEALKGRQIRSASGLGMFLDILCDGGIRITSGDGANLRYGEARVKKPGKYQLLIEFADDTWLAYTVAMYGSIAVYKGGNDGKYYKLSRDRISPLAKEFDLSYFRELCDTAPGNLSVKALLATEQRIPGLGNGSLQDILFNASIHPKRKAASLSAADKKILFQSVKRTIRKMLEEGGRDTENDLYGNRGGYKTLLSKNTYKNPCRKCSGKILKEAYLGGAVYFCPKCQPI